MKRYAIVTETAVYRIEFDAPEPSEERWQRHATYEDELDELARAEWDANPSRRPIDYTCEIDVEE